jgi:hypothetical protein
MVELPAVRGVTTPVELTVATEVRIDVQKRFMLVAFEGLIVAVMEPEAPPATRERLVGFRLIPHTDIIVDGGMNGGQPKNESAIKASITIATLRNIFSSHPPQS